MCFSKPILVASAVLVLVACQPSEQDDAPTAMAEISAASALTGQGAKLAADAVIGGQGYRALGQYRWHVSRNGQGAVVSVPIAEYRAMTGDRTPAPHGHRRSSVIVNIRHKGGIPDRALESTKEIGPYAGLRRTVDPAYPDTSGETLWLPRPYDGVIQCRPRAIEDRASCQLQLTRGNTVQSVTIPATELARWRQHVDAFAALMDRATAT